MENTYCKLLLIDDDINDQKAFIKMVEEKKLRYDYKIVDSFAKAKKAFKQNVFDVVITDYLLEDGTALDIIEGLRETPVIITTGAGNEEIAVRAMKSGAFDYLIKDQECNYLKILPVTIENAIQRIRGHKKLRMLSHALMSIGDSVYITDVEGNIIFINRGFINTYGYEEHEILGEKSKVLWDSKDEASEEGINEDTLEMSNCECYHIKKDGSRFPVLVTISYVFDEVGNKTAVVGVVRDITEIRAAQEQLRLYATTDILTGVLNRRAGLMLLEKQMQLCKRNDAYLCVCYIDVNGLKDINDQYGHQEGDQYIQTVIALLKECIRESDTVCRIGGDEFLLILVDCSIEKAKEVWRRIEEGFDNYNKGRNKPYCIGISYGLAEYGYESELGVDELVDLADGDMYRYKKTIKCSML